MIARLLHNLSEDREIYPVLTGHAKQRMFARGISTRLIDLTIAYGRVSHVRGAIYYAIGRREIDDHRKHGVDLRPCEGLHIVCSRTGAIITVYRNKDLRDLKPHHRFETFDRSRHGRKDENTRQVKSLTT